MKLYYRRNRTQALAYAKRYYGTHREEINARNRANHKLARLVRGDDLRAQKRIYQKLHPDKFRVQRHRRRARTKASMGVFTEMEWKAVVARTI